MLTLHLLARRFVGQVLERPGAAAHPAIVWAHELSGLGRDVDDEVPWCSSLLNLWCWLLGLPRSSSAAARSWLTEGVSVPLEAAEPGWDIVVLSRGANPAQGHVGVFEDFDRLHRRVRVIGGNQSNGVTVEAFNAHRVLDVRRLR